MHQAAAAARVLDRVLGGHSGRGSIDFGRLHAAVTGVLGRLVKPVADATLELLGGDPRRLLPSLGALESVAVHPASPVDTLALPRLARIGEWRGRLAATERPERFVPAGVATLLVVAAVASALPPLSPSPALGGPPSKQQTRIIVAGLDNRGTAGVPDIALSEIDATAGLPSDVAAVDVPIGGAADEGEVTNATSGLNGTYRDNGAIVNALGAPQDATDGKAYITTYVVASGDTLRSIAVRFHITMNTLYWANKATLPDPAALRPGQLLIVPLVNGLVVVVDDTDTLESLALEYGVETEAIVTANNLASPVLVIGQTLIIPGVSGGPLPTPIVTPTPPAKAPAPPKPATKPKVVRPSTPVARPSGRFAWPVAGRGRISRGWSYGHPALDIAAPYGTAVLAAQSGTVVYAGWRSYSGGGNVVWIAHGGGMYTTYNHLSKWYVSVGQAVGRGQRVAAIGMSGVTTGPHLHFEVWLDYPWHGGTSRAAVNPCRYVAC